MGVIIVRDDRIVDIIEKPQQPVGTLATIGMYFFRTSGALFSAIDRVLAAPPKLGGEYFLADAIKLMIEDGAVLNPYVVGEWEDTGTIPATLHAHRWLLDRSGGNARSREGVTIVPPVYIAEDADVRESVIGPYVTVESGCRVERSVLSDCVLDQGATIRDQVAARSLLGRRAVLEGSPVSANVGDDSAVTPPSTDPLPSL